MSVLLIIRLFLKRKERVESWGREVMASSEYWRERWGAGCPLGSVLPSQFPVWLVQGGHQALNWHGVTVFLGNW